MSDISESSVSELMDQDTKSTDLETLEKEVEALEQEVEIGKSDLLIKANEFHKVRLNFEMAVKDAPTILKLKAISEALSGLASLTSKLTASSTDKGPKIDDKEMTTTLETIFKDMIDSYTWINKDEADSLIKRGKQIQKTVDSYKQGMTE